jgi:P27 family predicted phage terminase small subunit
MTAKNPPSNLSHESRVIWLRINRDFILDYQAMVLLKTALEAYDRMSTARKQIDEEGATFTSPTGLIKLHPALRIEKEARSSFLQAWRALGFNLEPPGEIGRPPGRFKGVDND